jgi:hypothetical protein
MNQGEGDDDPKYGSIKVNGEDHAARAGRNNHVQERDTI